MASEISASWTTTPKQAVAGYRAAHPVAYWFRIVAAAILVLTGFVRGDIAGLVVGIGVYWIGYLSVRRQLGPAARGELDHLLVASDDEVQVDGAARPWSAFRSAGVRGGHWVLRLNPAIALAVPVDAVDGTGFEDLLRSKGLAS
jgi:hypothetical protein